MQEVRPHYYRYFFVLTLDFLLLQAIEYLRLRFVRQHDLAFPLTQGLALPKLEAWKPAKLDGLAGRLAVANPRDAETLLTTGRSEQSARTSLPTSWHGGRRCRWTGRPRTTKPFWMSSVEREGANMELHSTGGLRLMQDIVIGVYLIMFLLAFVGGPWMVIRRLNRRFPPPVPSASARGAKLRP